MFQRPCWQSSSTEAFPGNEIDQVLVAESKIALPDEHSIVENEIAIPDDVFYYEHNDVPGVCVMSSENVTPIKISKSQVWAVTADSDTSGDEICLEDCLSFDYQPHDGVPGFLIETSNDSFWTPIAHRTRSVTRGRVMYIRIAILRYFTL